MCEREREFFSVFPLCLPLSSNDGHSFLILFITFPKGKDYKHLNRLHRRRACCSLSMVKLCLLKTSQSTQSSTPSQISRSFSYGDSITSLFSSIYPCFHCPPERFPSLEMEQSDFFVVVPLLSVTPLQYQELASTFHSHSQHTFFSPKTIREKKKEEEKNETTF